MTESVNNSTTILQENARQGGFNISLLRPVKARLNICRRIKITKKVEAGEFGQCSVCGGAGLKRGSVSGR